MDRDDDPRRRLFHHRTASAESEQGQRPTDRRCGAIPGDFLWHRRHRAICPPESSLKSPGRANYIELVVVQQNLGRHWFGAWR